jgi:hypothetical protein
VFAGAAWRSPELPDRRIIPPQNQVVLGRQPPPALSCRLPACGIPDLFFASVCEKPIARDQPPEHMSRRSTTGARHQLE